MHDVFISYSSKNKNVADAIVADMEHHGIKCWYAPRDVLPGDRWAAAVTNAIEQASIFVLVYTEDSNNSKQVTNEVTLAVSNGKTVIPFRLSRSHMNDTLTYYLSSLHWLDAIDPPLNRNIEVLREKVLSILKIEDRFAANSDSMVSEATANDAKILTPSTPVPSSSESSASGGTGSSDTDQKSNRGALIGIVAAVVVVCVAGFALFGSKSSKSVQESTQGAAVETLAGDAQKENVAEAPAGDAQKENVAEESAGDAKQEDVAEAPTDDAQQGTAVESAENAQQKETAGAPASDEQENGAEKSAEEAQEQGKQGSEASPEEPAEKETAETPAEPEVEYILPTAVPEEYYYYNGHTYSFYDASRYGFTTYDEVSEFCHEQGGHLAVINGRGENSFLYNLMKDNYKTTVFFGYTDKDEEGVWVWDGDESSYENWTRSGDWKLPDNGEGWGGGEWLDGGEDYAEFNYDRDSNWGAPNDTTWNDATFMENTTIFFCEWEYDMREAE